MAFLTTRYKSLSVDVKNIEKIKIKRVHAVALITIDAYDNGRCRY